MRALDGFSTDFCIGFLSTNRLLHLQKLVDSPVCTFCNNTEETLVHLFWECQKVQEFWSNLKDWLHTNFVHCNNITFTKDLIILGIKDNVITDRIFDLIILMAKFHIFVSKVRGAGLHMNNFIRTLKNRYISEKYENAINSTFTKKFNDWLLYSNCFS